MELTMNQALLLRWLAAEDASSYGECCGRVLDSLVDLKLAKVERHDFGDSGRVALTDAGRDVVDQLHKQGVV